MSELIITDITSLGAGKVCIAGELSARVARLAPPNPTESWVTSMGGLSPGSVIGVRWHASRGIDRPHVEDGAWEPTSSKAVRVLTETELVERLRRHSFRSVREAFGDPWFVGKSGNAAFRPSTGSRSLATVQATRVALSASFGKPKVRFRDRDDEWTAVPFQDLEVRKHFGACARCETRGEQLLREEFEGGPAILRVGLARVWRAQDQEPACWLQVNHIFLTPSRRRHFAWRRSER